MSVGNCFESATEYLKIASQRGSKLGLDRISELMKRLGDPQEKIKIVHVAGTNGKGSFCAMLSSVLTESGYRTGTFSSPALTGVTDSFRIDCKEISEKIFAETMAEIIPECEKMSDKPTEFEILTACAYLMFYRQNCDIAVIECGMGGDGDSTNIVKTPLLSVITNVRKDHTAFLGDTPTEIATHKAGIIKKNCPVFLGDALDDDVVKIIKKKALENNSLLFLPDYKNFSSLTSSISGINFLYRGINIGVPLGGTYQFQNVVNAINCVEILKNSGLNISYRALRDGLAKVTHHGRFEILRQKDPVIIFDGSHNPDGIRQMSRCIDEYFHGQKIVLFIGVMADKEYGLYGDILGNYTECAFTVTPDNPRSLDCRILAESLKSKNIDADFRDDFETGVRDAFLYAKQRKLPLIALGSLYMYSDFVKALENI